MKATDNRYDTMGKRGHHYWHTCSDCGYDFAGPANADGCPICGEPAACAVGGECVDDSKYDRGGPDVE